MTYKVEAIVDGQWDESNVGGDSHTNRYSSRKEAEKAADELAALDWGNGTYYPRSEFRVVEVESNDE